VRRTKAGLMGWTTTTRGVEATAEKRAMRAKSFSHGIVKRDLLLPPQRVFEDIAMPLPSKQLSRGVERRKSRFLPSTERDAWGLGRSTPLS